MGSLQTSSTARFLAGLEPILHVGELDLIEGVATRRMIKDHEPAGCL